MNINKIDWSKLGEYAKTIASILGWLATILTLFATLSSDGSLNGSDWSAIIAAVFGGTVTTVGVYNVKNKKA
jgi:hypothetical protein